MDIDTDDNDPVSSNPLHSAPADLAAGKEPGASEETEAPPEQPPGSEDISHDPDASDESIQEEAVAREEAGHPLALNEAVSQPTAAVAYAACGTKPGFLVEKNDPPSTAKRICTLLAEQYGAYQRGGALVALWADDDAEGRLVAKGLSVDDVITALHEATQPFIMKKGRTGPFQEEIPIPERMVRLCLSNAVVATLPPLRGIAYAPRVEPDGGIHNVEGYDPETGIYYHNLPELNVPAQPTRQQGEAAYGRLRARLRTFPFADSIRVKEEGTDVSVVDLSKPPGADESACITALFTAVCRPSLDRVPGLLATAPHLSGAGTGKGKLVRFISEVAYGFQPSALTPGDGSAELDKRLSSELMTATPIILLDNVNGRELQSNLIASAITENPAQVRLMGTNKLVPLNPSTFMCVTGNGLGVTEDLIRRFLVVRLNAGMESPEARRFSGNFLAEAQQHRASILSDVLTVVTFGLQQGDDLPRGLPLGSFEGWCHMVRDTVQAFTGRDPVADIAKRRANDSQRSEIAELFSSWWHHHGDRELEGKQLHVDVWDLLAPHREPRQRVAQKLIQLDGTVCNGFRLRMIEMSGKWSANRYRLECIDPALLDHSHRTAGGSNGDLDEAGDGFEGLGAGTQPLRKRRS
jgi:hypothetical protein